MRLANIRQGQRLGLAACAEGRFHVSMEGAPGHPGSLAQLVRAGADLGAAGRALLASPGLDPAGFEVLPPLLHPGKILCIGLNYAEHISETGLTPPIYPEVFARFASTLVGHGGAIVRPELSTQLDFEGELAVVVGRGGRRIPATVALEHVAGYSVFNDASLRDYQFKTRQWTMGKNFDGTGAFGPVLVTPEELPPGARGLRLRTRLNGVVLQDTRTDRMIFDVATLIAMLSEVMTLSAGDLIVTGTPSGVGFSRQPPVFMVPGDVCEVEVEGVGLLRNPIVEETTGMAPVPGP